MAGPMTSQAVDNPGRVFAVVPAAGRSNRMGSPKQLLEVEGRPMLLAVVDPLSTCPQVAAVLVVTNSLVASTLDLTQTGASVVLNDEPDAEMIDSVRLGVTEFQTQCDLAARDGILICPGDQPGLSVDDITRCCQAFLEIPGKIIVATHDGKTGHPLIFPASLIPCMMSSACDTGLRELPRQHAPMVTRHELTSPAVTRNINTPPDYGSLSTS
jgi:molybdenum cofactor cytidylyltransferase